MSDVVRRYESDDYYRDNPTWDMEDSPWKAHLVASILGLRRVTPKTVCDVGCGAGKALEALAEIYPETEFRGFDIAPAATEFWKSIRNPRITFTCGDFRAEDGGHYDLILALDVLEHLGDPHEFLASIRGRASYFCFHIPLDLSAISVLREAPLLYVRRKVGHVHYFTKGLAMELLDECAFEVLEWRFTGAAFNSPQASKKTRVAQLPRRLAYALNKEIGVRLLGGETLMVLAKPRCV